MKNAEGAKAEGAPENAGGTEEKYTMQNTKKEEE